MTGKLRDLTVNRDGTQNVTVTVACDFSKTFDALKDKEVSVEIKKAANGRSISQNAFMWSLCSEIGRALKPPQSKEFVYRMAIKAVGVYSSVMLTNWDLDEVRRRWEGRGTGWFVEVSDTATDIGRTWVHLYYGTSVYTVDEMKLLIEWLVDQAEQMELQIPAGKEREELYHEWGFC